MTSNKKPGDSFDLGSVSVQYRAEDAAGNHVECSFTVNVNSEYVAEADCRGRGGWG